MLVCPKQVTLKSSAPFRGLEYTQSCKQASPHITSVFTYPQEYPHDIPILVAMLCLFDSQCAPAPPSRPVSFLRYLPCHADVKGMGEITVENGEITIQNADVQQPT